MRKVIISWPNGKQSIEKEGSDWLKKAREMGVEIPTGCLGGSCGACEIDVNGKTIRACISSISYSNNGRLNVEFAEDPFWRESS